MARSHLTAWWSAGWDTWALAYEASEVIAMRAAKLGLGQDLKGSESRMMFSEKMISAVEMQAALMTGSLGTTPIAVIKKVLRHYRSKVRANRRRLAA